MVLFQTAFITYKRRQAVSGGFNGSVNIPESSNHFPPRGGAGGRLHAVLNILQISTYSTTQASWSRIVLGSELKRI